jgi:catechol 2,3-dioxygenase-like lactoylglutathione lyase family enzyme
MAAALNRILGAEEEVMRFNHITLVVSDFERSRAFYTSLGLIQIVESAPRYARFVFPEGDATLSIEFTGEPPSPYGAELFFECENVDRTVAELKLKGVMFDEDPTDMPYLWREARLRDPDGYDIRLYHAGENRLNPPWRIGAAVAR